MGAMSQAVPRADARGAAGDVLIFAAWTAWLSSHWGVVLNLYHM